MKYNGNNLTEVLKAHKRLADKSEGYSEDDRADLRGANLRGADLRDANLYNANLYNADLRDADLRDANLRGADLRDADLYNANLYNADLRDANLYNANLYNADLRDANLRDADLYNANLCGANLCGAKNVPFIPLKCPEVGAFIGWKKASGNSIVKLQITEDAKRTSATTDKCRCSKAIVLAIENVDGTPYAVDTVGSNYDSDFLYKVGEIVTVDKFDEDRWNECSTGIHFFINRQSAVDYR